MTVLYAGGYWSLCLLYMFGSCSYMLGANINMLSLLMKEGVSIMCLSQLWREWHWKRNEFASGLEKEANRVSQCALSWRTDVFIANVMVICLVNASRRRENSFHRKNYGLNRSVCRLGGYRRRKMCLMWHLRVGQFILSKEHLERVEEEAMKEAV